MMPPDPHTHTHPQAPPQARSVTTPRPMYCVRASYDNDLYASYEMVRVGARVLDAASPSAWAGAVLRPASRVGLVVGALQHTTWKSAVVYDSGAATGPFPGPDANLSVTAFGGLNGLLTTRDLVPHGALVGDTLSSPRFRVAYHADWRHGPSPSSVPTSQFLSTRVACTSVPVIGAAACGYHL